MKRLRGARGAESARGQASLEFLGILPVLLLIALAGIQLGLAAYTASQATTAARTAARTASLHDPEADPRQAGLDSVSGWLQSGTHVDPTDEGEAVKVDVTMDIPSVIPGMSLFGPVHRTATMPKEDSTP
ncbi:pilus assembly protein [Streptomyces sp. RB6PN25]|uniref:Pilus assembly protein n=1 Tax=Streptomyces humicola TaxID=2953240 RepID=A0ABT1PYQ3_9ACTN|nr:TadE/TadG family type IV pilus assembly protein [Streptomyces humicola]MCQ4082253.1 pilus assembly protein [Streptomyces humicola]